MNYITLDDLELDTTPPLAYAQAEEEEIITNTIYSEVEQTNVYDTYTTEPLSQIEEKIENKSIWKNKAIKFLSETYKLSVFVIIMCIISTVFVNFDLFYGEITRMIKPISAPINIEKSVAFNTDTNAQIDEEPVIDAKLDTSYHIMMEKMLKSKISKYKFSFNLLPPTNRIIINKIAVNAPIVDVAYKSSDSLQKGDFDKELYAGVVKYPYTPLPGEKGNILLFGHTSYYWWKKNDYGTIFSQIPKLNIGDEIQVIWEGKLYTYKILEKMVRSPQNIEKEYNKYADKNYLTLMGCYPIGTDKSRILVVAQQLNTDIKLANNDLDTIDKTGM